MSTSSVPGSDVATSDPRSTARALALVSAGLVAAPALYAAFSRGWHSVPRASLLAVAALAALPHAYLALLPTRRDAVGLFTRDVGLGVVRATRFALIVLALYPVQAILMIFGSGLLFPLVALEQRMAAGFGSVSMMALWGLALFAVQWMLALALRRLPASPRERGSPRKLASSIGPLALAIVFVSGLALTRYANSAAAQRLMEPEVVPRWRAIASAGRVVEEAHRCAQLYATAHGGTYPDSLAGLWMDEPRCRVAAFDLARSHGIELHYRPHRADNAAPARGFDLVARVDSAHDERRYALLTDETAIDLTATAESGWPGSADWPDSTVELRPATRMMELILDEAEHVNRLCWDPGHSAYPADPATAGPYERSPNCSFGPSPRVVDGRVYDLKYVPGDTTGAWARGFAISARPRTWGYDGFRSYLMQFRGLARVAVHATAENRAATANDPVAPPCETAHGGICRFR